MFLGVPYIPFAVAAGSIMLLTYYWNMFCLALLPPVIFVMRHMARRDEMIFRLIGLRLQFRLRVRNVKRHEGLWAFTPNAYRDPSRRPRR